MIKRENGKVYAFIEVLPANTILKINIYDQQCHLEYEYETEFIDANWNDYIDDIEKAIKNSIHIVKEKIMNNYNVIHTYQKEENTKLVEKNLKFLKRNKILLKYLNNYQVKKHINLPDNASDLKEKSSLIE